MFALLLALTGSILAIGVIRSFHKTGDALHPLVFLVPLFMYSCVMEPWLVRDALSAFLRYEEDVHIVLLLNCLSVGALVLGASRHDRVRLGNAVHTSLSEWLTTVDRVKLQTLAITLSVLGLLAYGYSILNGGGLVAAYSRAKGGGSTESGYVGEAMNLGLVGVAMVSLSQYRRGWTWPSLLVLIVGLLPNVIHGTLGGRRGPLFIALTSALFWMLLTRRKTPRISVVLFGLGLSLVLVVFVWSQRQHLYLSSEMNSVDWGEFERKLSHSHVDEGNNFVYGAGFMLTAHHSGQFTWGRQLAVNLLVRPIPKQVWPTKYHDAGAVWVTNDHPGLGHFTPDEWIAAVGWVPLQGSAAASIFDLFGEFGWGAVAVMYLIGRGFAEISIRRRRRGGVWMLLHLEALMLSIYLATQTFSAFYHRYLLLVVPTIIAWRMCMKECAVRSPMSTRLPALRAR